MWYRKELLSCLIILTTVQTSLICPEVEECKCQEISQDSIEIGCPEYENGVNIKMNDGMSAIIDCIALIKDHEEFDKLLPELNITIINHLKIYNCSLPTNKSLAELLSKVNMDKVSELEVRAGKFQSNHFNGFSNLKKLKINCPDYKNVPKQLFNQLDQLTHLNLSNNNISELDDETFWENINLLCLDLSHNQLKNISK